MFVKFVVKHKVGQTMDKTSVIFYFIYYYILLRLKSSFISTLNVEPLVKIFKNVEKLKSNHKSRFYLNKRS